MKQREESQVIRRIVKMVVHPEFAQYGKSKGENFNDIMLLKLDRPLNLNDPNLGSICVPEQNEKVDTMANRVCTATGWGVMKPGMSLFHSKTIWDLNLVKILATRAADGSLLPL